MPAEGRENPLLKKGNSDAFFREKYLTKNRVIVTSITSLSRNCSHASQAMAFPHGDLAINQNLIGIVDDAVHNSLRNRTSVIRVRINVYDTLNLPKKSVRIP